MALSDEVYERFLAVCDNCGKRRKEHVGDQCLFLPTHWKMRDPKKYYTKQIAEQTERWYNARKKEQGE